MKHIESFRDFLNEGATSLVHEKIRNWIREIGASMSYMTEIHKGMFKWNNVLYFTLLPHFNGKDLYLHSVWVDNQYRKQGRLKEFLRNLKKMARKEYMKIYIDPNPMKYLETPYISRLELIEIYKRYDFLPLSKKVMVWSPKNYAETEESPSI